jgi:hypothetical protein
MSTEALTLDCIETANDLREYLMALYGLAPSNVLADARRHLEALIEAFGGCAD